MVGFLKFAMFVVVLSVPIDVFCQIPEDNYNRAYVYAQKGFFEDAVLEYQSALKLSPNRELSTRIRYNMGLVYLKLKDTENAEKQFELASDINPNLFLVRYHLANVCYNRQKYSKAVEEFRKSIEIDPKFRNIHEIYSKIGISLHKLEKFDEAIKSFKKALSSKPDYVLALKSLSKSYLKTGSFDDAEKCLNRLESLGHPQKDVFMELQKAKE